MWQFSPNSIHYLLGLWQRMVCSTPYIKSTEPHLLETYTPEVTYIVFVTTIFFKSTGTEAPSTHNFLKRESPPPPAVSVLNNVWIELRGWKERVIFLFVYLNICPRMS